MFLPLSGQVSSLSTSPEVFMEGGERERLTDVRSRELSCPSRRTPVYPSKPCSRGHSLGKNFPSLTPQQSSSSLFWDPQHGGSPEAAGWVCLSSDAPHCGGGVALRGLSSGSKTTEGQCAPGNTLGREQHPIHSQ